MLTKLTAVNAMLAAIGEAPVSSLEDYSSDAEVAIALLDEVTTEILTVGWSCNTDYDQVLAVDAQGNIPLPADTIKFISSGWYCGNALSARIGPDGSSLLVWNATGSTFTFTYPVRGQIIHDLPFDQISAALKSYAKCKAARIYQSRIMGAVALDRFLMNDETEAFIRLTDDEGEIEPVNVISSDYTLAWGRRHARSFI